MVGREPVMKPQGLARTPHRSQDSVDDLGHSGGLFPDTGQSRTARGPASMPSASPGPLPQPTCSLRHLPAEGPSRCRPGKPLKSHPPLPCTSCLPPYPLTHLCVPGCGPAAGTRGGRQTCPHPHGANSQSMWQREPRIQAVAVSKTWHEESRRGAGRGRSEVGTPRPDVSEVGGDGRL